MSTTTEFTLLRDVQRVLKLQEIAGRVTDETRVLRARVIARMALLAPFVSALMVLLVVMTGAALAHDSWISRGGHRNAAGEWCCGEGDCDVVDAATITVTDRGYKLSPSETVPYREAQPSPDGQFWRCHRPDGSRRCFFAPPPGS